MKFLDFSYYGEFPTVELTRRNLQVLLDKLDDPDSNRTIIDGERRVAVKAVEDIEHYADREPGTMYMPATKEFR